MNHSLLQQTLRALEWDVLLDALAAEARSVVGIARCRALPLDVDLETARLRQQETMEMLGVFERVPTFPSLALSDVSDLLRRSAKGATLDTQELREILRLLRLSRDVKRSLRAIASHVPRLWELAQSLEECPWVREAIDRCIDEEGRIRESATPELAALFQQTQSLRRKIRFNLESLLTSGRFDDVLQGRYFAERANRYVLPVKAERQHEVPGIVHDVSSSGATVFIEPQEMIDLNNAVKTADLQLEREVQRLLHDLSAMVGTHHAVLAENAEILATLDVIAAKARLSRAIGGRPVALTSEPRIVLRQARHPLLVLRKAHVVANDIVMDEQVRVLVISGPNTGGKTVTLKLLGVVGLMVKVGLLPPCEEGSAMAVFPGIYADIGDAQDLAQDLSSFSAHLVRLIRILDEAQAPGRTGLVLLDELGTSTDPLEGAALAEAIVDRLSALGCKVAVTTHFPSLKTLAFRQAGVVNVSHEFDLRRLAPTYRLLQGLPGGSSAMEIAARLGLAPDILDRAHELLQRNAHVMEAMFHELQQRHQQLQEELQQVRALRCETERMLAEARERADRIKAMEKRERTGIRQRLQAELAQARRVIHEVVEALKTDQTFERAREAQRQLAGLENHASAGLDEGDLLPVEQAREGDWVELRALGLCGQLMESLQGKKYVKVRVGDKELNVPPDQIAGMLPDAPAGNRTSQWLPAPSARKEPRADQAPWSSGGPSPLALDVRGKSVDEAIEAAVSALDRAMASGLARLRVIHGRGSGKLKTALRSYFAESPYVARFRPGEQGEGGDGVTVLELKD